MTTVAEADIRIGLNDAEAIAGLRAVDKEVDRTLRNIDGKEAEYKLGADVKRLKRDLKEADKAIEASRARQAALEEKQNSKNNKRQRESLDRRIKSEQEVQKRLQKQIDYQGKRLKLNEDDLAVLTNINKTLDSREKKERAIEKALDRRARKLEKEEAAERRRMAQRERANRENERRDKAEQDHAQKMGRLEAQAYKEDERRAAARQRQRDKEMTDERAMMRLHSEALAMDERRHRENITGTAKHEAAVQKLQSRYSKLEQQLARTNKEARKLSTIASPTTRQNIEVSQADAIAEMALIQAELKAMGAVPVVQHIDLRVDEEGRGTLGKWIKSINDTAIRIGPITTSIAGLGRGLLLLGPIVSGVTAQIGALVGVLGAGLLGALGSTVAGLGAFGLTLGGVGLLMPKLMNDLSNLNSLQDAYHKQVLKTGANSEKAKTKLKEFNHALGEVPKSTLKTFEALERLSDAWDKTAEMARPDFYKGLSAFVDMAEHRMPAFQKATLGAFTEVRIGWEKWMKGLQSSEADRIFDNLSKAGTESIQPLMRALGNLGTVFGRVAESFGKLLPDLMRGFETWTGNMVSATEDGVRLDGIATDLVGTMKDLGHFTMAAGRFLVALFAPSVDPGRGMLQNWTEGLNNTAAAMRGAKRERIQEYFEKGIETAQKFWGALKPVAQLFFEWSTIMQPFTNIALDVFRNLAKIAEALLSIGAVKGVLQWAFGIFLYGAVAKRVASVAIGLASMYKYMKLMVAMGGLKAVLAGGAGGIGKGLLRFGTGGLMGGAAQPGATPARPMFTKEVGLPGKGLPGRGPGGPTVIGGPGGGLGWLKALPNLVKVGGGITAIAAGFATLHKAVLKYEENNTIKRISGDIKEMTADRNQQGLRDLIAEFKRFPDGAKGMEKAANDALKSVRKLEDGIVNNSIESNFENIARGGSASMRQIKTVVERNMITIEQRLGTKSDAGRKAVAKNFRLAAAAVRDRMRDTGKHTKQGMDLVEKYMIQGLEALGLTKAQATAKVRTGTLKNSEDRPGAATIPKGKGAARGGLFQVGQRGQRGPDSIPMNLGGTAAVVAPGEQIAVFNHHQQKKFASAYPGGLDGFFAGPQRPHHYAGGGIVDLGRQLQRAGYAVSEHPAFGGVQGGHAANSYHYRGMALDVNADAMPGGEKANLDRLYARLQGMPGVVELLWQVADHFDHLHVAMGGPGGILGALAVAVPKIPSITSDLPGAPGVAANAAIQVGRSAAKDVLTAAAESFAFEGGESFAPGAGAATRTQMEAWAKTALRATQNLGHGGPTPGNVAKILELAMKESSWIVDSINNWDINAQRGNPSGGLMHVTLDKVGGNMNALFDPVTNMIASIVYQMSQYKKLITFSPYAQGGLVDHMGPERWARGGKIDRPTLLTGEDGKSHPEFVVGTNPMFRKSNVAALQAAAAKLGVPTARESTKHKGPQKLKNTGKEVDKLAPVVKYEKLQQDEQDKQRQISIAQSRVKEPASLIEEFTNPQTGLTEYRVNQTAVDKYTGQMQDVRQLYWDLIGKKGKGGIMGDLLETGTRAQERLSRYRVERDESIAQIQAAIARDEGLLKSKNKGTRKDAQKRLEHNRALLTDQRQKKQDAGQKKGEITSDMHDARYRIQEYDIEKTSLGDDIRAVAGTAAKDAAAENQTLADQRASDKASEPTANEVRGAQLDAELALAQIGQGINGQPPRSEQAILTDQAALQQALIDEAKAMLSDKNADGTMNTSNDMDAYSQLSSAASALAGIQAELAKYDPRTNDRLLASAVKGATSEYGSNFIQNALGASMASWMGNSMYQKSVTPFGGWRTNTMGMPGVQGGFGPGRMGGTVVNLKPQFANVPPDPHSWSKQVAFEIGAAL